MIIIRLKTKELGWYLPSARGNWSHKWLFLKTKLHTTKSSAVERAWSIAHDGEAWCSCLTLPVFVSCLPVWLLAATEPLCSLFSDLPWKIGISVELCPSASGLSELYDIHEEFAQCLLFRVIQMCCLINSVTCRSECGRHVCYYHHHHYYSKLVRRLSHCLSERLSHWDND